MEIPPRENKSLISTAMPVLPATTNRDRRQPFSQGGRDHAQSRSLAPSSGGLVGGRYQLASAAQTARNQELLDSIKAPTTLPQL